MPRHPLLAVLTILTCACGSDGPAPGQGGTVRATIYGAERWGDVPGPLPGVSVTIAGKSEITSDLGIAYIAQLPSGVLDATIERPGSELLETQVAVTGGDTVDMIEQLLPLRPATGRVEARVAVRAAAGSPVLVYTEGATVTMDPGSTAESVRLTDGNGAADFPFAAAGGHWIRAAYEGTIPDSALIVVQGGDTVRVNFVLDPTP
jgi:hypothetical protein